MADPNLVMACNANVERLGTGHLGGLVETNGGTLFVRMGQSITKK